MLAVSSPRAAAQATAGDPKRPDAVVQYTKPEADADALPNVMLLVAMGLGMGAMFFKIKWLSLAALICLLSALSKWDSTMDTKTALHTSVMIGSGLVASYGYPLYRRSQLLKEMAAAAQTGSAARPTDIFGR